MKIINQDIQVLNKIEELVEPSQTAIIVIDVQNAIISQVTSSDGSNIKSQLDVANVARVIPKIHDLLVVARTIGMHIIYAEFIHRNRYGASLMDGPSFYCVRNLPSVPDLIEGEWNAQTIDELAPQPGDLIILKSRGSALHQTNLDNYLKTHSIRSLIITGLVMNGCVLMTAVDCVHHGYYPVVLSDCVSAYDLEWHELTLQWMKTQFPVFYSHDVFTVWGTHKPLNKRY